MSVNAIVLIGYELVAMAFGLFIYVMTGQTFNSILLAVYVSGFFALTGFYAVYPGGKVKRNEWGEKIKIGNLFNLSKPQIIMLLAWFLIFGAYLIYRIEFNNVI